MVKSTHDRHDRLTIALIFALFFGAIAPTLDLLEFSNGAENLVIATALEVRREGCWLIPTLHGEPRVAKPPLAAWLAALSIGEDTMRRLSDPDPTVRDGAERDLAWQSRWPFLASSCAMLVAVHTLGRIIAGNTVAMVSALITGTNLLFLRFGRAATTDVQLALWVTVTSAFLAMAAAGRGRWIAFGGAGVALGLAFMSKGPVAILQTVVPFIVWWLWNRLRVTTVEIRGAVRWAGPALVGAVSFALVALPWFVLVALKSPDVWSSWRVEVTREGATALAPGKWYGYLALFPYLLPWSVFFVTGAVMIACEAWMRPAEDRVRGWMLPLLLVVIPLLTMSFFRDRKERYMLPMLGPAAIVAARAISEHLDGELRRSAVGRAIVATHWGFVALLALGLPIASAAAFKTIDGTPWYSSRAAFAMACGFALLLLVGIWLTKHQRFSLVATTVVTMLAVNFVFIYGYRDTREGRSELKPLASILWQHTGDMTVHTTHDRKQAVPSDLSIYLNRTVRWIDAPDLRRAERPCVVVIRQGPKEEPPQPPTGATEIARVPRDRNWWYAFAMEPEARTGSAAQ